MNRQEAWELLNQAKSKAIEYFWGQPVFHLSIHPGIFVEMVDLLKPHTPDPKTGLVNCGCGGKAHVWPSDLRQAMATAYQVGCIECAMTTVWVRGKQENAVKVWNTAMGWKGGAE